MTAAWIFFGLIVGTLVAAATNATAEIARLRGLPTRWAWAVGIALSIGLFLVAPIRSQPEQLPAPETVAETSAAVPAEWVVMETEPAPWRPSFHAGAAQVERVMSLFARVTPPWLEAVVRLSWALGSLAILLLVVTTQIRYRQRRRLWPRSEIQGVPVRIAPRTGPAVLGVAKPEIVVPRWVLELCPAESAMVIAHEEEHVRARDPLLLLAAWLGIAILPWHPAIWWMAARLRLAVEMDCDRRVLRRGMSPRQYGALLIELSQRSSGFGVGMAALAGHPSQLERRLIAMTSPRARYVATRALPIALVAAFAVLVACEAKLPTAAEVAQMDVADAEAAANRSATITTNNGKTTYFVDGLEVSAEEARRLAPEKIAAIELSHADDPNGVSRIITVRSRAAEGAARTTAREGVESGEFGDAILFIDGKRAEARALAAIRGEALQSIEVIKDGEEAIRKFGSGAEKGVVVVRTRTGTTASGEPAKGRRFIGRVALGTDAVTIAEIDQLLKEEKASPTVYVLDGKASSRAAVEALPAGEIWRVAVNLDPETASIVGPGAENGVVSVLSKTGSREQYDRFRVRD